MTAHSKINQALVSRGMMPMDGHCSCDRCGKSGLRRDQIVSLCQSDPITEKYGDKVCHNCLALADLEVSHPHKAEMRRTGCPTCKGKTASGAYDYVRGKTFHDHCGCST